MEGIWGSQLSVGLRESSRGSSILRYAEKAITRALCNFDIVFYQSQECLEQATSLLGTSSSHMVKDRHIVLARGIPEPPLLPRTEVRKRIRAEWGIADDHVLVINIGTIYRAKGLYELVDAISLAGAQDPRIRCVVIGSLPAFDETIAIQKKINGSQAARRCVTILPLCDPPKVWEYLCAGDIFAFPSSPRWNAERPSRSNGYECSSCRFCYTPGGRDLNLGVGDF